MTDEVSLKIAQNPDSVTSTFFEGNETQPCMVSDMQTKVRPMCAVQTGVLSNICQPTMLSIVAQKHCIDYSSIQDWNDLLYETDIPLKPQQITVPIP